jgi:hypothetical protein
MAVLCLFAELGHFDLRGQHIGVRHDRVTIKHSGRTMSCEFTGDHLRDSGCNEPSSTRSSKVMK